MSSKYVPGCSLWLDSLVFLIDCHTILSLWFGLWRFGHNTGLHQVIGSTGCALLFVALSSAVFMSHGWHIVKHGLDWICNTWTGFVKHGLGKGGFVKHGFVKGGFVNYFLCMKLYQHYCLICHLCLQIANAKFLANKSTVNDPFE